MLNHSLSNTYSQVCLLLSIIIVVTGQQVAENLSQSTPGDAFSATSSARKNQEISSFILMNALWYTEPYNFFNFATYEVLASSGTYILCSLCSCQMARPSHGIEWHSDPSSKRNKPPLVDHDRCSPRWQSHLSHLWSPAYHKGDMEFIVILVKDQQFLSSNFQLCLNLSVWCLHIGLRVVPDKVVRRIH